MNNISLTIESLVMRMFKFFGMRKIAWSLRRLHCPVDSKALVLEIGAGGNPYFRSNILVDAYESTGERHWVPLTRDRPTVLAFAENLPFKDKQFDFVIASHVVEHSIDPIRFLDEMQRVSKAGYIEVPDAFMERINPYPDHRLEITVRNGRLLIRKKQAWQVDPELVELYEVSAKKIVTGHLIPSYPFDFHVRYYWTDKIDYEVVNPEVEIFVGEAEQPNTRLLQKASVRGKVQTQFLKAIRSLFSQHGRNSQIDLFQMLQCTHCRHDIIVQKSETLICQGCGNEYPIRNGIPDMTNFSGSQT
jgi:antitoxin component of MazEF toxin-antitoxin module